MNAIPYTDFTSLIEKSIHDDVPCILNNFVITKDLETKLYSLWDTKDENESDPDPILETYFPKALYCFIYNIPYHS